MHRLVVAVLLLVEFACLWTPLPTPVRFVISFPAGALAIGVLARAGRRSATGRVWLVFTSMTVVAFNLVLWWIFTSDDDNSIGGGFAILLAFVLVGLTAIASFASFLGSAVALRLDRISQTSRPTRSG